MLNNNDYLDRARIRAKTCIAASMPWRTLHPVLLSYWTRESLEQFLVPCTEGEISRLSKLHNIDENGPNAHTSSDNFRWLKELIYTSPYLDETGEWYDKYFIDKYDHLGQPLVPSISLPPSTLLITTGYIPVEGREGKGS